MLRNEGDVLPLPRSGKKIALIGPFAGGGHDLIGPWNVYGTDREAVDLVTAVRGIVPGATVDDGSDVARAVAAARAADVVVLAIGETQNMSGEAQSRTEIVVPAEQQVLAEAIAATGKPYVVLLRTGRALALAGAVAKAPALLVTWFLGSQDGPAIADVLFGAVSPSARLPVSFPRASGQVPYYYAHRSTGRPNPPGALEPYKAHFRDVPNSALFAFGHGLTYGDIVYSDLRLSSRTLRDTPLTIRATIANSGRMAATEVVQLYVHDVVASVTQPVRVMKAFTRVTLAPGARQDVTFTLNRADLSFTGRDLTSTTEVGAFHLWVAPSAEAEGLAATFTLA
jgi:beta-glucosidase